MAIKNQITKREWEIINPSDECYISGEGEALAAAGVVLGRGKYALKAEDGTEALPLFLFGGEKALDEWWRKTYGRSFNDYLDTKPWAAIADVLETFRYAGERSSMNNIGNAAKVYAKSMRDRITKGG